MASTSGRRAARGGDEQGSVAWSKLSHSYSAREIAGLYKFPAGRDGKGQSVGVIALSGGYRQSDMRVFFKSQRLPLPSFPSDFRVRCAQRAVRRYQGL